MSYGGRIGKPHGVKIFFTRNNGGRVNDDRTHTDIPGLVIEQ